MARNIWIGTLGMGDERGNYLEVLLAGNSEGTGSYKSGFRVIPGSFECNRE